MLVEIKATDVCYTDEFTRSGVEGRIHIDDLITHVLPLERINEAVQLMHEGKSIRSVVVY